VAIRAAGGLSNQQQNEGEPMMPQLENPSRVLSLLAAILLCVTCRTIASEPDFFVATGGNDQWSGTTAKPNADNSDGPFATVQRAQLTVRELRKKQPDRAEPIIVAIRGGNYWLDKPIQFEPEDSGTEKSPVIYQAYENEQPILSGGRPITGWKLDEKQHWYADLPEAKDGKWSFVQIFVNQQRRDRVRMPKQGYYKIAKSCDASPKAAGKGNDRFGYNQGELDPNWQNLQDVEVIAFHQWAASRLRVASIDAAGQVVTLQGSTTGTSSWAQFNPGARYFVTNIREALSDPGEWYLDRTTGRLTYVAKAGESIENTSVVAPYLRNLLLFTGDLKQRRWVQHLQLKGLTFAHTNWTTPPEGQSFPQAEINLGAAVAAIATRNVSLEGCAVRHTGEYGIGFGAGCKHNRLEGCELVDLGAGGIKIGNALPSQWNDSLAAPADEEAEVSHHTVNNCLVAHGGRLHPAAIGVWIGHSPYNTITHNDVFDFYYTAFSIGWVWGYAESHAHHNEIAFNHAHHIGQGVLSDMGCTYTLGVSPGTTIHDNHFHDVVSYDYGGWGLYTDEGSTGIVLKNNLVYRCSRASFHQHYGKENRVENNILANAGEQQLQRTRTEPHTSFFFERNLVYWENDSPLLGSNWNDNNFRMDNNLYFHAGKPVTFFGGLTLEQWQKDRKQDQHSVIADPGFVDVKKDDFRLKPDSPALKLGFVPFDYSKAGRTEPPKLTAGLPEVPSTFQ
jgi:hypothetical protein